MLKIYYSSSPIISRGRQPKRENQKFQAIAIFRNDDDCIHADLNTRQEVKDFITGLQRIINVAEETLRYPKCCISSDPVQPVTKHVLSVNDLF